MAYKGVELATGEWYHCYTRTIDASRPFEVREITERFLETIYLANQKAPIPNIPKLHRTLPHDSIFALPRQAQLVSIGVYAIMPTHYHLLVQPLIETGLTEFMHKLGTGFTRFYNEQHKRVGNLFIKPFRAKHISNENYFRYVPNYIHLNAAELFEPHWKKGCVRDAADLEKRLRTYRYSSLPEYEATTTQRPQAAILDPEAVALFREHLPPLSKSIADAIEYYRFLDLDF